MEREELCRIGDKRVAQKREHEEGQLTLKSFENAIWKPTIVEAS